MLKYSTKSEFILAIAPSSRRIQAVLLHDTATGPVVLRTFVRKRAGVDMMAVEAPEIQDDIPSDVSFQATEDSGVNAGMFLASEFGDLPVEEGMDSELMAPTQLAVPCDLEIQDIVSECADAGYENVRVVFALPSDYLGSEVFSITQADAESKDGSAKDGKKAKKKSKKKSNTREALIKQLQKSNPAIEDHQVAFLPLFDFNGKEEARLALYSQSNEPVTPSLKAIRNRKRPFPGVALLDNEVSLLLGAARASLLAEYRYDAVAEVMNETASAEPISNDPEHEEETSVVIRVGADDTLVMFMVGQELVHYESLRSITAFDPTDTICSRILLMYDEFGAGDSDRILLFCDESETAIRERLEMVFPDSTITLLRHIMPPFEEVSKDPLQTETLLAILAGLRLVRDELWESVFPETSLLDPQLRGRKFTLPFSWPVAAMILILFSTTLFFVQRYFAQSHEIEMVRFELRNYPEETISGDAGDLQSRIDSLRMRSNGFVEALDVLDSLLVGSDVWSRALERTAANTGEVDGLWIRSWGEEGDGELVMTGTALDRNRIVEFASRAEAIIEQITYAEIRGVPVFEFQMTMLIHRGLPDAAYYLREHAAEIASGQFNQQPLSEATAEPVESGEAILRPEDVLSTGEPTEAGG